MLANLRSGSALAALVCIGVGSMSAICSLRSGVTIHVAPICHTFAKKALFGSPVSFGATCRRIADGGAGGDGDGYDR